MFIMEPSVLSASSLDRNTVLFFLIILNTRSSTALLWGMVNTARATLLSKGKAFLKTTQMMSTRWYRCSQVLSYHHHLSSQGTWTHASSHTTCGIFSFLSCWYSENYPIFFYSETLSKQQGVTLQLPLLESKLHDDLKLKSIKPLLFITSLLSGSHWTQ